MRCKDFLTLYSDFRDELIVDPAMNRRMIEHIAHCRSCARYHEALEVGTRVLRESNLQPSERFLVELRCRLALARRRVGPIIPAFGWPASVAATLLIAIALVRGVNFEDQGDTPETETPQVASVVEQPRQGAAVRARFEAPTPPDFRPPELRFTPATLDLNSKLDTWQEVDSSPGFITVHATLSR